MWRDVYYFKYTFMFDCYGDITLKNVWLLYANTEGQQIGANIQIQDDPEANATGKGEVAEFDGVIFDYSGVPPQCQRHGWRHGQALQRGIQKLLFQELH